jgi:hypothetical protein
MALSVIEVPPPVQNLTALYERTCDIVLVRIEAVASGHPLGDDANVEGLFEDRIVVAVSNTNPGATGATTVWVGGLFTRRLPRARERFHLVVNLTLISSSPLGRADENE